MSSAGPRATEPESERLSPVRIRRFSVAEYHGMIKAGILGEDEHVELLEGEIVEMSPQGKRHARAVHRLTRWFNRALGDEYVVRPQLPLTLDDSEPEPDLAIVAAEDDSSADRHPTTALLVVEVATESVRYDLKVKSRIYARAGIPEYWLVVTGKRTVEILRDPEQKAGVYRTHATLSEHDHLEPAALQAAPLSFGSLFD
jgi:Uma2 family endonuclease